MKKMLLLWGLVLSSALVMAVPVKRGMSRVVTLPDGSEVKVQLVGDEHIHYWLAADGRKFVEQENGAFTPANLTDMKQYAAERRLQRAANHNRRRAAAGPHKTAYYGSKKGIIILVDFTNKHFGPTHDRELFDSIANRENYHNGKFVGSVHDYFLSQSRNQFDLTFDVVGPVQMDTTYQYYGKNDSRGNDLHPGEMVAKACMAVDDEVDFTDYDWDGDGVVDQVFVLYAGEGEASSYDKATIWPHEWQLVFSDWGSALTLDGVFIDTYACGNEVYSGNYLTGIGTICHEFSHCMGLPDMYDTSDTGLLGTGDFDLLCSGCYNDDGYRPACYTSYERWVSGWHTPTMLDDTLHVEGMRPLASGGESYVVYNKLNRDEYYLLENRQKVGWDSDIPGEGMLIYHVDYDPNVWMWNVVNSKGAYLDEDYIEHTNDHERFAIVCADNYSSAYSQSGDPYPYRGNNALTHDSKPKLFWYKGTPDFAITEIEQQGDGLMGFTFLPDKKETIDLADAVLWESFNGCSGKGGNDNVWGGSAGTGVFAPDNEGWTANAFYGAHKCAKGGVASRKGTILSPEMALNGDYELTFKAAPWDNDLNKVVVNIITDRGDTLQTLTTENLSNKEWSPCTMTFNVHDNVRLSFTSQRNRFFIDDIMVKYLGGTAIRLVEQPAPTARERRIYRLNGTYAGSDLSRLPRGIYVVNGRKVVK